MKCLRAIFGSEAYFFSGGVKIPPFFFDCDLKGQWLFTVPESAVFYNISNLILCNI